jgi:hypothetical protein
VCAGIDVDPTAHSIAAAALAPLLSRPGAPALHQLRGNYRCVLDWSLGSAVRHNLHTPLTTWLGVLLCLWWSAARCCPCCRPVQAAAWWGLWMPCSWTWGCHRCRSVCV